MAASSFPTRISDLSLHDSSHNPSLYAKLRSIRKSTLSIPNRLTSILDDAGFAKEVCQYYKLPLVANERCGSWYINPSDKAGSAYFKSTDGHHGQWDFSPRRLNLQLLNILAAHGGAVVVDSTRRGKTLPDAFSKTVPIWVAVINRALFPECESLHRLQTPPPPGDLAFSESTQIQARLDAFTATFCSLNLDLQSFRSMLGRPIRVSWAINGLFSAEDESKEESASSSTFEQPCHHLVLCSASRRVLGAEASGGGYIQGAGDDSEGWSHGLTAQLFWGNKDRLMNASEDELPALIEGLLRQGLGVQQTITQMTAILQTPSIHVGSGRFEMMHEIDLIIHCQGESQSSSSKILQLGCRLGKLGSKDLREKLPEAVDKVGTLLLKQPQSQILISCSTGKDISIGVATAILCLFYDDQGENPNGLIYRIGLSF